MKAADLKEAGKLFHQYKELNSARSALERAENVSFAALIKQERGRASLDLFIDKDLVLDVMDSQIRRNKAKLVDLGITDLSYEQE
jgi:hypothetical protein